MPRTAKLSAAAASRNCLSKTAMVWMDGSARRAATAHASWTASSARDWWWGRGEPRRSILVRAGDGTHRDVAVFGHIQLHGSRGTGKSRHRPSVTKSLTGRPVAARSPASAIAFLDGRRPCRRAGVGSKPAHRNRALTRSEAESARSGSASASRAEMTSSFIDRPASAAADLTREMGSSDPRIVRCAIPARYEACRHPRDRRAWCARWWGQLVVTRRPPRARLCPCSSHVGSVGGWRAGSPDFGVGR